MYESYKQHLLKQGFELGKLLGQGLSGHTYEATQASLNRSVAVKFFDSPISIRDSDLRKRFKRESRLLADLQHPSIPYVLTHGDVKTGNDSIPYIVMQYITGETLDLHIKQNSPLSFEDIKEIAFQILDALSFIHHKGVVHRDIKPSNIMITPEGECFLIDFSIGFKQNPSTGLTRVTRTGDHLGTAAYMSPEQWTDMKIIDHRSDIYSFSKLLCELLTRKPEIDSLEQNSNQGELLKRIIAKGLEKSPEDRYSSADEFKRELLHISSSNKKSRSKPSRAICINTKCPSADWSPNGYYRGPYIIEESSDSYCTSCGQSLIYSCVNCGNTIANTQFCGGCGTQQFLVPECEKCGSFLTKPDMGNDTSKQGCQKCQREQKQDRFSLNDDQFDDEIPF